MRHDQVEGESGPEFEVAVRVDDRHTWTRRLPLDLAVLRRLVHHLTELYPWSEELATAFLLCAATVGEQPIRRGIHRWFHDDYHYQALTFTVDPWVSAESLLREFRRAQRAMLGRENRPLSPRTVELFNFCIRREHDEGKLPPFRQLCEEWNREHPGEPYAVRNFARDYHNARRQIMLPTYGEPWPPAGGAIDPAPDADRRGAPVLRTRRHQTITAELPRR